MKGNYNRNTKSKIQNRKYINRNKYFYRTRRTFNIAQYPTKTKPTTFGPGTYRFAASKIYSGSLENQISFRAYTNILIDSPEFSRVVSDFKYIRIAGITVTFYARNLPVSTNMTPAFFIITFDGDPVENLRLQDNVKRVPPFLTRDMIFKYFVPNINCQYGGPLSNWRSITDLTGYDDIYFQMHAPDNTSSWHFKVDLIIKLKGPTNAASKILDLHPNVVVRTRGLLEQKEENEDEKEKLNKTF